VKRAEHREVERIVNLWIDYLDNNDYNERLAKEGEGLQGKIHTYKGDLPRSGSYKPETIAEVAERLKPITRDQKIAHWLIMNLKIDDRLLITQWQQKKKENKPRSGNLWTMREVGLTHGMNLETFKEQREIACYKLLIAAKASPLSRSQEEMSANA